MRFCIEAILKVVIFDDILGNHLMIEDDISCILTVTASFGKSLISLMNLDGNKVFAFQDPPVSPSEMRKA